MQRRCAHKPPRPRHSVTLGIISCYLPGSTSGCPWATHLPSRGLGFLNSQTEMMKAPTPRRSVELNELLCAKCLDQGLLHSEVIISTQHPEQGADRHHLCQEYKPLNGVSWCRRIPSSGWLGVVSLRC